MKYFIYYELRSVIRICFNDYVRIFVYSFVSNGTGFYEGSDEREEGMEEGVRGL